ncbi:MAG: iron ABC transporter permease [Treponema sp.]|jgi:iron(III) transport system permease protein|nr:iron ABC transporter permease [Treponema sp.]
MKSAKKATGHAGPAGIVMRIFLVWVIAAFLVYPNINMILGIFYKNGGFNADIFRKLFSSGRAMKAMRNSFVLALSMIVTVNITGTLLVFFTEYLEIRGAKILKLGYMSTLVYGGIILCTGYKYIYGARGIITKVLMTFSPGMNPAWFTGYGAVIFIMTFACTSNHIIFLTNAIRGIDYQTIEAARNLGASPLKIFLDVVFPVLKPTIFAVTILTFLTGLGAMSAPLIVGGTEFQTINPMIISFAQAPYSRDLASLMSVILGTATILFLVLLNRLEKKGNYISVSKVKSGLKKLKISNLPLNILMHLLAYFLFLIYVVPIVLVIIYSFSNSNAILSGNLNIKDLTIANYQNLLLSATAYRPLLISITYSISAAILAALLTVVVSRILHKSRDKLSPLLEYGMLIPWLLPNTMIAMGLMTAFDRPRLIMFNKVLIGTVYLLLIAYVIAKLPFCLRMIRASFFSVDKSLEEAAQSLGSGPLYAMIRVVLPIILPAVLSVIALSFNGGLAEYDMTAFLYHPLLRPLGPVIRSASDETASLNAQAMTFVYAVLLMIFSSITLYLVYGKKPAIKRHYT